MRRRARAARPPIGFTLMEMMIVIAMLGVIAAIAVPNLMPVVNRSRFNAAVEDTLNLLERARRLAYNEGRCYRVREDGDRLVIERREHGNCFTIDGSHWSAPVAFFKPPTSAISFSIDTSPAGPGGSVLAGSIIFRASGRLRGDGNLDIKNDGARVLVQSSQVPDRTVEVLVMGSGRMCAYPHGGTPPAFDINRRCGTGFGGSPPVTGPGGGCSATTGEAHAPLGVALAALFLLGRRRRASRARRTRTDRRRRGYLLFEVMVSSGILAIILGGTLAIVASARADVTAASRRSTAAALAQAKADELAGAAHVIVGTQTDTPIPGFEREWRVTTSGKENASSNTLFQLPNANALHEIEVIVRYEGTNRQPRELTYKRYRRRH